MNRYPGDDDEAALFRASVGDVRPVSGGDKARLVSTPKQPLPLQRQRDEIRALRESLTADPSKSVDDEKGDSASFLRAGLSRQALRRLRAGHWVIQDEIDLHGNTLAEAKQRMSTFLARAMHAGARCVRVIHGKGLRNAAEREPVLKNKVRVWLSQREEVLAYCEARPAQGGSGAVIVLLRAPHGKPQDNDE